MAFLDGDPNKPIDLSDFEPEELARVFRPIVKLFPMVHLEQRRLSLASGEDVGDAASVEEAMSANAVLSALDDALQPRLETATDADDPVEALVSLKVADPACGGGRFLIAAARRVGMRLAQVRAGGRPSPDQLRAAVRDSISRCVYGVDVDPFAVDLTKAMLTIEGLEPDVPLVFLDHHIKVGNCLVGATPTLIAGGIPDDAFVPIRGDDAKLAKSLRKRNRSERDPPAGASAALIDVTAAGHEAAKIGRVDDRTVDGARDKAARLSALEAQPALAHARDVANAWCGAFLLPRVDEGPVLTDTTFKRLTADPDALPSRVRFAIDELAHRYRFLHWHLAFPEVFVPTAEERHSNADTGWSGGFDAVIINPPWARAGFWEQAWFTLHCPRIAQLRGSKRAAAIRALQQDDPLIHAEHERKLRQVEGVSHFVQHSGRFPVFGQFHSNTYANFAEVARQIGRAASDGRVSASTWRQNLMSMPGMLG